MMNKCLYCYKDLPADTKSEFHPVCAKKIFGSTDVPELPFVLSEMAKLAQLVVERSVAVPGVQPKISMGIIEGEIKQEKSGRMTVLDALEGLYILKPPHDDFPMMPENEHLTMLLAEAFRISVVPSSLMRLKSGELCYVSRRVDRNRDGEMLHMIDFLQILGLEDKYRGTMEQVGKKVGELSERTLYDKFRFFELTMFNFIVGNNDMHLKNFSMLLSPDGWELSPAYDLVNVKIILPKDEEDLALMLGGKKKKHSRGYFERFAEVLDLEKKQFNSVMLRIRNWLPQAEKLIGRSFLLPDLQEAYRKIVHDRARRLEL